MEQGITTPLLAKKTDKRTAVIVGGNQRAQERQEPLRTRQPPKVILLTVCQPLVPSVNLTQNMVGPGQVDDGLQSEIETEASKYGKVIRCRITEVIHCSPKT